MSTILIVDDERGLRRTFRGALEGAHHTVLEAETGEEALDQFRSATCDLVLLDLHLPDVNGMQVLKECKALSPDIPVIIITGQTEVRGAVEAMKAQATDYLCKPIDLDELKIAVQMVLENAALLQRYRTLDRTQHRPEPEVVMGTAKAARTLRALVARVAASEAPSALILGESGTGKEVIARGLHFQGPRRGQAFIELNCASMSHTLFESELFGHERGSFTDAKALKRGLAELADKGTLFLDEIGEIPQPLQAKLLRFLQERRFRRVGGTQDITVDVRIVAATNQDLARLVEDGRFRRDLFYRLNMITIPVPPLRERQEDILMLAQSFLEAANLSFRKCFRDIHPEAAALLTAYHWPGNIRELRNVIERVVLLEEDDLVHPHHLPREITGDRAGAPVAALAVPSLSPECSVERLFPQTLEAVETAYIQAVLGRVNGNKTRAAEILNITRQTLRLRLNGTAGSRHE